MGSSLSLGNNIGLLTFREGWGFLEIGVGEAREGLLILRLGKIGGDGGDISGDVISDRRRSKNLWKMIIKFEKYLHTGSLVLVPKLKAQSLRG